MSKAEKTRQQEPGTENKAPKARQREDKTEGCAEKKEIVNAHLPPSIHIFSDLVLWTWEPNQF